MIQSDNLVLKQENELYRMTNERKAEENRLLKEELVELRANYAEKIDEAAALRTILEGIGHNVSAGLTRFMERRQLKRERQHVPHEQARAAVVDSYRTEQSSDHAVSEFAPPPKGTIRPMEPLSQPAPSFLNSGGRNAPKGPHNHPLLPRAVRSEEDILRDMAETVESRRS
jgi:hypothetical protein